jgi:hypothetical protein
MEEETEVKKERIIYWSASEVFTKMEYFEFNKLVMPFIKAYYKHNYGNELFLHEHETIDVLMTLHVDRNSSTLTFYHEPDKSESSLESVIKNDRKDLTPENIFDFIYYEYQELFDGDCVDEPKKETKKTKITL